MAPVEHFAALLAEFYTKKGFQRGTFPEAAALQEAADVVLTYSDGLHLRIICIVDRTANPDRRFTLQRHELKQIADSCKKYRGKVNGWPTPMPCDVIEIGGSPDERDRARLRALGEETWILLPETGEVWSRWDGGFRAYNGWLGKRALRSLMASPEEAVAAANEPSLIEHAKTPVFTFSLMLLLTVIFAGEVWLPASGIRPEWEPSTQTLFNLGGLTRDAVLREHQWFRIITVAFLHGSGIHLVLNVFALFMAGNLLERWLGHSWFLALFFISAVGGAGGSMLSNGPGTVSVGASGAIMGLLTTALVMSSRLRGIDRERVQEALARILIPSLLPSASSALSGASIDFGAHIGGAVAGGLATMAFSWLWSDRTRLPALPVARAVNVAAASVLMFGLAQAPAAYAESALIRQLVPDESMPKTNEAWIEQASSLLQQYPRDPRARYFQGFAFYKAGDRNNAKDQVRQALEDKQILTRFFGKDLEIALRTFLVEMLIEEKNLPEARTVAKPVCTSGQGGGVPEKLQELSVCG